MRIRVTIALCKLFASFKDAFCDSFCCTRGKAVSEKFYRRDGIRPELQQLLLRHDVSDCYESCVSFPSMA